MKQVTTVKVTNVPQDLANELTNIADNLVQPRAKFLKEKFQEIRDSYPQEMRRPKSKD